MKFFDKFKYGDWVDGFVGIVERFDMVFDWVFVIDLFFWVMMEILEKLGNVGVILWILDVVGVDVVIYFGVWMDWFNLNMICVSMGVIFSLFCCDVIWLEVFVFVRLCDVYVVVVYFVVMWIYFDIDFIGLIVILFGLEVEGFFFEV